MSTPLETCAWAGPLPVLGATPRAAPRSRLDAFVPDTGKTQRRAWDEELEVLQAEGAKVIDLHPAAKDHTALLEYALPREAGRRPDGIVLQNGRVVVEFKETGRLWRVGL